MNTLDVSTPRWMNGAITSSVEGTHTVNSYVNDGFIEVNSHYFHKQIQMRKPTRETNTHPEISPVFTTEKVKTQCVIMKYMKQR